MDTSLIAEQLRAWAEVLEDHNEPHLIGMRAGMEEVANSLERGDEEVRTVLVPTSVTMDEWSEE